MTRGLLSSKQANLHAARMIRSQSQLHARTRNLRLRITDMIEPLQQSDKHVARFCQRVLLYTN